MAAEQDALASKILLMKAGNKIRAKSWLTASLGEEPRKSEHLLYTSEDGHDEFAHIEADDEISGIGAPRKTADVDDFSNRRLLSANDALRKKLLSTDAYKKYQKTDRSGLDASKPMPKKERKQIQEDSEDEGKGRSGRANRVASKGVEAVTTQSIAEVVGASESQSSSIASSRGKKRPGSYLDQLLADRGKKKKGK